MLDETMFVKAMALSVTGKIITIPLSENHIFISNS